MKKPAICIVDDEAEEGERFKKALKNRFDIGVGASLELALRDLDPQERKTPDLYLLDLYEPESPMPVEDARKKLQEARKKFLKAASVFQRVLGELGQTRARSFNNARRLAGWVKRQPFAFFTRKGTLEDVIAAHTEFGVIPIIKKPEPEPKDFSEGSDLDELYDKALKESTERLEADILEAIKRCTWWWQYGPYILTAVIIAFVVGVASSLTANLIWRCLFGL
jgi:hypothetical protein